MLSILNECGVEYMVVGSFAAMQHGHIRTTHDMDLVAVLSPKNVEDIARVLGDEFYLDLESAKEAIERRDMFNAIHFESGVKIDFWILKDDDFARTQFSRRLRIDFEGIEACVESAEDTILSKLLWYLISPSERQLSDVQGILQRQDERLDWDYLRDWASRKGVDDLLKSLSSEQITE